MNFHIKNIFRPKTVEFEIKSEVKWRMRDDWMMKKLGHPSSRRKMLITPKGFELYLKTEIYFKNFHVEKVYKGKNLGTYNFLSSWANKLIIFTSKF
jgi:hypothetical protein